MSGRIKFLIVAALVLISAAALTFVNSRIGIDYCKGAVKLNDGFAVLNEADGFASVIKLDNSGKVTDRVNMLLNDPFTLSVKSVHKLFTDDKDNLYFFCSVYGPERSVYETIYRCNFLFGSAEKIWSSEQIDGYAVTGNSIPYIDGDDIYIPMLNPEGNGTIDILRFSDGGYTVALADCCPDIGLDADTIYCWDGVVFISQSTVGIFADGEKIYPGGDEDCFLAAMNYDNGILSFVDLVADKLLHYDVSAGSFSEQPCRIISRDELQSMRAYSDGTITATREDGEYLRAYRYYGGVEETYSLVEGGFSPKAFAVFTVAAAAAAALLALAYTLLFVRIRRQKGGARRYQSIAARITAISTAAGIVCGIVFSVVIYGTVGRLNSSLQNSIETNGSQFLAGYIFTDCDIELKNGMPTMGRQSGEKLAKTIEGYQTALAENNDTDCAFLLLVESNGKLYWLGDQFDESLPAEYVVSIRAIGLIRKSIDSGVNCTFEDRMTSGMLRYTCTNFPMYGNDNAVYDVVLCTVTDAYRIRQTALTLYLWLIAVVFGLVVLLLVAANIVLHCSLSGLKRLRKAFALYENGGEPSVFVLPDGDEIAETGQALMLMTEGTRVHARDINEGNQRYKRFMAAGILRLMDRTEISKVNFGDHISENAMIMRFPINNSFDVSERVGLINRFIGTSDGILLNYGGGKADVCFTDEEEYGRAADMAAGLGYPSAILASFGRVEAGSAGSDRGAWLIALSEEFIELERIGRSVGSEPAVICTKKLAEKLEGGEFPYRCELRAETLGDTECIYIVPRELGEVNEETTDNNIGSGGAGGGSLDPVLLSRDNG